jgi:hypothetical protein
VQKSHRAVCLACVQRTLIQGKLVRPCLARRCAPRGEFTRGAVPSPDPGGLLPPPERVCQELITKAQTQMRMDITRYDFRRDLAELIDSRRKDLDPQRGRQPFLETRCGSAP